MNSSRNGRPFSLLVLLPTFNSGSRLVTTVREALAFSEHVLVVADGSTDGSPSLLESELANIPGWRLVSLEQNSGKGGAVLRGLEEAAGEGHTHVLVMDADGQHSAAAIPEFADLARANPDSMILGVPQFSEDAPSERVYGRRVGNWFANLATLWGGIEDSLFGFRVYPLSPALRIMKSIRTARRFDFDTEISVRLFWEGVGAINRPVPVYYPAAENGGVTHFHYFRDNLLLAFTHCRLFVGMLVRLPLLLPRSPLWRR